MGFTNGPSDLSQFIHQVHFGVQSTCRVNDDDIIAFINSHFSGLVCDCCGISIHSLTEESSTGAVSPDLQLVYGAIAKQQGTTAALVGQRRALQIADNAKPGEWLQDAGGKWVQK